MMKQHVRSLLFVLLSLSICSSDGRTQDSVEEPSTGKIFPKSVSFEHGTEDYSLILTGVAVRKKLVFKGYGMAHYMDAANFENIDMAIAAALSDVHAKQITIEFARDIGRDRIRNAFRGDFKKCASAEEMMEISALVDRFTGYFDEKVKKNDRFVLRWLPGGIVVSIIQGREKASITSVTFAKVLWRIWLGDKSVVDRERLVELAVGE
ncbi:MAG: chalcone isomerase family protein [Candidatus Krumholzibacteria bacterium]|nr:chalcone isomerase family protein [Candidatus Krumholzibacteria bacterium]